VKLLGSVLTVAVDGKTWCTNKNYKTSDPGRKNVKVYASDPWHNAANARYKDFDYEKMEAPKETPVIQGPAVVVRKNTVLKHITTFSEYTYTMDIKPSGKRGGWTNLIHFMKKISNGSRIPGVWFYSGTTRMHVRQGRPGNGNDGCDPLEQLKMNHWSSIKVTQAKGKLKVFINGALVCENSNYGRSDPKRNPVIVYGSDPWYNAALASVKNVKYFKGVSADAIAAKLPHETLKKGKVMSTITTYKYYNLSF